MVSELPPEGVSGGQSAPALPPADQVSDARVERAGRWFLAVAPLGIAVFYAWQVFTLPRLSHEPIVSPGAWPTAVAVTMLIAALVLTVGAVFLRWNIVQLEVDDVDSWRDITIGVLAIAAFITVFETVGFVISVFALISALSLLVSPRKWKRNLMVSALFAVASHALFAGLLGVRLPDGLIPLPWS